MNKITHAILMVKKEDTSTYQLFTNVCSFEGRFVSSVNGGGCLTALTLTDGSEKTFDKAVWDMYDLTPTKGWNHTPAEDVEAIDGALKAIGWLEAPAAKKAETEKTIAIGLVRDLPCEGESWSDALFLTVPIDYYNAYASRWNDAEFVLDVVRDMAKQFLQTPAGLSKSREASNDFNWGDLVDGCLPLTIDGKTLSDAQDAGQPVSGMVAVRVEQDEHLAPDDVDVVIVTGDGNQIGEAVVDFTTGEITFPSGQPFDHVEGVFAKGDFGTFAIRSMADVLDFGDGLVIDNIA